MSKFAYLDRIPLHDLHQLQQVEEADARCSASADRLALPVQGTGRCSVQAAHRQGSCVRTRHRILLCADIQYKDRENRKDVNGDHYDGPCKHMIREMLLDPSARRGSGHVQADRG